MESPWSSRGEEEMVGENVMEVIRCNAKKGHQGILVVAEHNEKAVCPGTFQLLGKGRELADVLGVKLYSLVMAGDETLLKNAEHELIAHGADLVYSVFHRELEQYRTLPYTKVVTQLILEKKPEIVLFLASTTGRDLAPRVASRLRTGLTADCTNLVVEDYEDKRRNKIFEKVLLQIRPAFGGDVIATIVSPEHYTQMATVRRDVFSVPPRNEARKGEVVKIDVTFDESDMDISIDKIVQESEIKINLKEATIIVSGGRGLAKNPEMGFNLVHELAKTLGGMVGASRGAVDKGWIDHGHQVGQTGQTVKPESYIACGISGAIQHLAGMSKSKIILAINSDPEAPIFKYANYGIVGNVFDILPKLIEKAKAKR